MVRKGSSVRVRQRALMKAPLRRGFAFDEESACRKALAPVGTR
jgi:hypothetical protein